MSKDRGIIFLIHKNGINGVDIHMARKNPASRFFLLRGNIENKSISTKHIVFFRREKKDIALCTSIAPRKRKTVDANRQKIEGDGNRKRKKNCRHQPIEDRG